MSRLLYRDQKAAMKIDFHYEWNGKPLGDFESLSYHFVMMWLTLLFIPDTINQFDYNN